MIDRVVMDVLTQILVFRFDSKASFEGGLLGALERIEAGSAIRILDVLFARRDTDGELELFASRGGGASASDAIRFRLDPEERQRLSAEALERRPELAALVEALEPGGALAAVLLEHRWAEVLAEAVERTGGSRALAEFVDANSLEDAGARIASCIP